MVILSTLKQLNTTLRLLALALVTTSSLQAQNSISVQEVWQYEHIINETTPNNDSRFNLQDFDVDPDGQQIALAYRDDIEQIEVVDTSEGRLVDTLQMSISLDVTDLEWSYSGDQLAVGSGERVFIWHTAQSAAPTFRQIEDLQSPEFSWSPEGQIAIASRYSPEETLVVLHGTTFQRREAREIRGLYFPRWSPDGRYIALYYFNLLGDENRIEPAFIDVWDTQNRTTVTITFPQVENVNVAPNEQNIVWLPDSSGLMGFTNHGALWRWSVGSTMAEFIRSAPAEDMRNQLFPIGINAQGDLLAVSNPETEYRVEIWDADTGEFLLQLPSNESVLFDWGADNMLYVYDGILHAYQVSRSS